MATHKKIKPHKRPSTMLGFLLSAAVILILGFAIWQLSISRESWGKLKAEQFLAVIGVGSAICGWLVTNMITLRNSVRQHTITTLLQSRLSSTYMGYADILGKHYTDYDKRRKENPSIRENPTDNVDIMALRYILNYFEFIAIGVIRGDLDESMLKDSLRSILKKNVAMSRPWIKSLQVENSNLYINLLWLHDRWALEQ